MPAYEDGFLKKLYDAYDKMSPEEGVSKKDGRHGGKIFDRIRDMRNRFHPTEEQLKVFRPLFMAELKRYMNLPNNSPMK